MFRKPARGDDPLLPFGEPGSTDYWVETLKRAFELGENRAQAEIWKLIAETGPRPPRDAFTFPSWFTAIWVSDLAPYNDIKLHHLRMPY